MPTDTVSSTSQNFYGYQTNSSQGQQTVYETSVQSQSQSNTFQDTNLSAPKSSMSTTGAGLYHNHHHSQNNLNQTMTNGNYMQSSASGILSEHGNVSMDPFYEYSDPLQSTKIITNFETKNPLKYPSSNRPSASYYKNDSDYHHPPQQVTHFTPHNYSGIYQNTQHPIPKISPAHNYEPYPRSSRNSVPHYPSQHYPAPAMDDHNASRLNYNRAPVSAYHQHSIPQPPKSYTNFYSNGYPAMPYSAYPQMSPGPPYMNPLIRNENCSKPTPNYSKTGAVALSPVEHGSFSLPHTSNFVTSKKDFYAENSYYPTPHGYYDESSVSTMNSSCSKKPSSRQKVNADVYNPNGSATLYPEHHALPHHPQNGNIIRHGNVNYQPIPKHYSANNTYAMPSNSYDAYHNINYHYKNGDLPKMQTKMNPALSSKQFKNYGHFEPFPHPHVPYGHPQYQTMHAKRPEKLKISLDLEEQINSSKIPKIRDVPHPSYFDPHDPHHYYQYHHHIPPRNTINENDPKNSIANINISLRDFLSTWNEIDDDEESGEKRMTTHGHVDDLSEHVERTIMREYNPMFVQKASDSLVNADVPAITTQKMTELESGMISEGTEKLYVLESIDVPLSELNKYKHLSVINKLPENVVISDKELYADVDNSMKFIEEIDLTRGEKLYKSEFELEFEACQERKISKPVDKSEVVKTGNNLQSEVDEKKNEVAEEVEVVEKGKHETAIASPTKKRVMKVKSPKMKDIEKRLPKIKQRILKIKKEKIFRSTIPQIQKNPQKVRITKRVKKYSLNQRNNSVKTLQSTCVDFLNTSSYRNYAREQLKIMNKHSKMRILKDFKKKFNFESTKKQSPLINQKFNHSVRINSLKEICGEYFKDKSKNLELDSDDENEDLKSDFNAVSNYEFPTLKNMCKSLLKEMDINIVENDEYVYTLSSLKELCEAVIYNNRQYFVIEEVSHVPKLQDLCKSVLSETNIFINIDEENSGIFTINNDSEVVQNDSIIDVADDEPIFIVEENSGNVGELFDSENLNSFEKSEILRKIQHVANIDDDDEIIRAIGALHHDNDVESIINNNNCNVSNRNIGCANEVFFGTNELSTENQNGPEMSFISYMEDDLIHSVQHEEIVSRSGSSKNDMHKHKTVEILRHKYLNRSDRRQASKTINGILKKSLNFQRLFRFRNAKCRQIISLKTQTIGGIVNYKKEFIVNEILSGEKKIHSIPTSYQRAFESHNNAKDETAQSQQKSVDRELTTIINDSLPSDDSLGHHAERKLPKLPVVFPSINEYKIDRKSSNRCDVKDIFDQKKNKLNFEESLLSIDKIYGKSNGENKKDCSQRHYERHHKKSRSRSRSRRNHRSSRYKSKSHRNDREKHHNSSSSYHKSSESKRSTRSKSRDRDYGSRHSHHSSSRYKNYKIDQIKHSEAKRLVIPSYKLYDKDLDVKLKIMPFVRIEREERVDKLMNNYN
ncbi:CLUMA_CG016115, isoform A [Clunio marinus]|uniref:CLUMA_CG016115, isoform A n=1 Tax=Clunio marinus TaxID=568069 RepID=A0A1J1IRC1_9DIPT|nr:CLUMA_CG016115, isoform A [Clunio marinus]